MLKIETVAVLGTGEGGTACAVLAALAGCAVRVHGATPAALEEAAEAVRLRVDHGRALEALGGADGQRVLDGILFTADLDEAITGADLVLAAAGGVPTPVLAAALARSARASAVVAAVGRTAPHDLAAVLPQPGRVLALRLVEGSGPLPALEVLPSSATRPHVLERARELAARANRAARPPAQVAG